MNRRQVLIGTVAVAAVSALPIPAQAQPDFFYSFIPLRSCNAGLINGPSERLFASPHVRYHLKKFVEHRYAIVEDQRGINVAFSHRGDADRFNAFFNEIIQFGGGDSNAMLFASWQDNA